MEKNGKITKYLWLDMEMTGLDPETCRIIEIAAIVTDLDLKPLDEYEAVIFQPQEILNAMDEWCTTTHGNSGLTAKIPDGELLEKVENDMMGFLEKNFKGQRIVLAGNSIGQDRKFIDRYMPKFSAALHYRMIDVSSFKEVLKNRYDLSFTKKECHRAKEDISESIAELQFYLEYFEGKASRK